MYIFCSTQCVLYFVTDRMSSAPKGSPSHENALAALAFGDDMLKLIPVHVTKTELYIQNRHENTLNMTF